MLSRSNRFTKKDFDRVMKEGRIVHSPLFHMRYVVSADVNTAKVAVVAPVKVAKTAVARNKARRRAYAAIRPLLSGVKGGIMAAVFAKDLALKADSSKLKVGIQELFVKAGIMR